jgi:hypothetical protein
MSPLSSSVVSAVVNRQAACWSGLPVVTLTRRQAGRRADAEIDPCRYVFVISRSFGGQRETQRVSKVMNQPGRQLDRVVSQSTPGVVRHAREAGELR